MEKYPRRFNLRHTLQLIYTDVSENYSGTTQGLQTYLVY